MSQARGSDSLYRLSQRLLALAGVLSLLLIAVVVNYLLHDGEATIDPFNPISAAASQTEASSGYRGRTAVTYTVEGVGAPVQGSGSFAYNAETERAQAALSVPTPAGTVSVETRGDPGHVYVRSAIFTGQLPDGAEWIGVEPLIGQTSPGFAGSEGAESQLQMLRAVADVERVGSEAVDGVTTSRYRGTIYLDRVADYFEEQGESDLANEFRKIDELAEPTRVEVWITPAGTLRQLRMISTIPGEGGAPKVTMDLVMTIDKLGVSPAIDLPDPGSVYDAMPLLRQKLEGLSG